MGFPLVVYRSSSWGGYLRCSYAWRSSDWRSQFL